MMLSITDHRMAGMAGIELLEKIKAINPAVTRILMSAFEIQDEVRMLIAIANPKEAQMLAS